MTRGRRFYLVCSIPNLQIFTHSYTSFRTDPSFNHLFYLSHINFKKKINSRFILDTLSNSGTKNIDKVFEQYSLYKID